MTACMHVGTCSFFKRPTHAHSIVLLLLSIQLLSVFRLAGPLHLLGGAPHAPEEEPVCFWLGPRMPLRRSLYACFC